MGDNKVCKKCEVVKDICDFYKNSNSCKSCDIERVKVYKVIDI